MSEFLRNAIAAAALILSVGSGVVWSQVHAETDSTTLHDQVAVLQSQMADLQKTVNAIYCKLEPGSIECIRDGR